MSSSGVPRELPRSKRLSGPQRGSHSRDAEKSAVVVVEVDENTTQPYTGPHSGTQK